MEEVGGDDGGYVGVGAVGAASESDERTKTGWGVEALYEDRGALRLTSVRHLSRLLTPPTTSFWRRCLFG